MKIKDDGVFVLTNELKSFMRAQSVDIKIEFNEIVKRLENHVFFVALWQETGRA